jgi:hypothetical protein
MCPQLGGSIFVFSELNEIRPKLHYFAEMLLEMEKTRENPRRQDLLGAEDYIGKMKKVGGKCHRTTVSLRIVQKIVVLMSQRWHVQRRRQ